MENISEEWASSEKRMHIQDYLRTQPESLRIGLWACGQRCRHKKGMYHAIHSQSLTHNVFGVVRPEREPDASTTVVRDV